MRSGRTAPLGMLHPRSSSTPIRTGLAWHRSQLRWRWCNKWGKVNASISGSMGGTEACNVHNAILDLRTSAHRFRLFAKCGAELPFSRVNALMFSTSRTHHVPRLTGLAAGFEDARTSVERRLPE